MKSRETDYNPEAIGALSDLQIATQLVKIELLEHVLDLPGKMDLYTLDQAQTLAELSEQSRMTHSLQAPETFNLEQDPDYEGLCMVGLKQIVRARHIRDAVTVASKTYLSYKSPEDKVAGLDITAEDLRHICEVDALGRVELVTITSGSIALPHAVEAAFRFRQPTMGSGLDRILFMRAGGILDAEEKLRKQVISEVNAPDGIIQGYSPETFSELHKILELTNTGY